MSRLFPLGRVRNMWARGGPTSLCLALPRMGVWRASSYGVDGWWWELLCIVDCVVGNSWISLMDLENWSFIYDRRLLCLFQCNFIWLMTYFYLLYMFCFCILKLIQKVLPCLNNNSSLFHIAVYPHCSSQLPGWCFWIVFHLRCDTKPVSNDCILHYICPRPGACEMKFSSGVFRGCIIAKILF